MLQSLHVKNLALIEESEIEFGPGLNILTGETGAGKSLLMGSIGLALGGKFEKDMLRKGADSALVELVFYDENEKVTEKLRELELDDTEDSVIISRRYLGGKSTSKINGETVTAKQVKELAEVLIDVYGQHEHQSLLKKSKHLEILDNYCGEELAAPAAAVKEAYSAVKRLRKTIEDERMDEQTRQREQALAEFEVREIEEAHLVVGEDEELEQLYRKMSNARRITDSLSESYRYTGNDSAEGAGNGVSRAIRLLHGVAQYDTELEDLLAQLTQVEDLLSGYNREVSAYLDSCEFDERDFKEVEDRLNLLNHLKGKYGRTIEDVMAYLEKQQAFLDKLNDYDAYLQGLTKELAAQEKLLLAACEKVTAIRTKCAQEFSAKLTEILENLNFQTVDFAVAVTEANQITEKGDDDVEFMISTNPGEERKPLGQVASGGELSRIMLGIKTMQAGKDDIDTLIFDEIDAGISGRTAFKVSEQLGKVASAHQVLCITHLPQIAAMADAHFVIEKSSSDERTITDIRPIEGRESIEELARLLGSDTLSEAALQNAEELKERALASKKQV